MADKNWDLKAINFYNDEGNCVQYTEEEYKRDLTRYLENSDWFEKKEIKGEKYYICHGDIEDCKNCAFYGIVPKHQLCSDFAYESFDTIKKIFVWAQEHPTTINADKLIDEVFGKIYGSLIKK